MAQILFANNTKTTLASGITNVATSCTVAPGTGALFPNPSASQYFLVTFTDAATGLVNEIVKCTARVGDVMTIVRAQEGTTALAWLAGDFTNNLWTAGSAAAMTQATQLQLLTSNYSADSGTANAYAGTYSPTVAAHTTGMPLWLLVAHSNTGASTFNPGPGVKNIKNMDGTALITGQIVAGEIGCLMYDGTNYLLAPALPGVASSADFRAGTSANKMVTPLAMATGNIADSGLHFTLFLPGGLMIQGGVTGVITGSGGSGSVSFPTPFPNRCCAVTITALSTSGSAQARDYVPAQSSSAFTIVNNGNNSAYYYIAVGG